MAKTVVYKADSYEIPFKITCTKTGIVKTYTSEEYINKKLDRFGGLEKLREVYVCKDAKRLLKEGKEVQEVIAELSKPKEAKEKAQVEDSVAKQEEVAEVVKQEVKSITEEVLKIAKKDKNGKWRTEKGHLIKEEYLDQFTLLEE